MISLESLFSRQPAPLLGIDISSSSVKLVELGRDKAGALVLERCAIEPLERGWITDGNIEKFDEVAEALRRLVKECHKYEKPISICGEMAGDPLSAILLIAMGFNTLSMSSSNILRVRKAICHVPMTEAQEQLEHVLNMSNPLMVKSWMEYYFKTHGLADMVKASTRIVSA